MTNYVIDITTLKVKNNKSLRPLTPNKDGVFMGVPAFVLGKGSRNCDYDFDALHSVITSPKSTFQLRIREGNCEGEYSHPFLVGREEEQIRRVLFIDRTRKSHNIRGVHSEPLENGLTLGTIDIKPNGPYGKYLEEELLDPVLNTAFSMRVFCHEPKRQSNGRFFKVPREFITIDAEGTPGWEEASKRYVVNEDSSSIGMESINRATSIVTADNIISVIRDTKTFGFEAKNNQLFDMLKSDQVTIENTRYIIDPTHKAMVDMEGKRSSVFHSMFSNGRM